MIKRHPHWILFASWAGQSMLGLWVLDLVASWSFLHQRLPQEGRTLYEWLFIGFVAWVIGFGVVLWVQRSTTVYRILDQGLQVRRGLLSRYSNNMVWHRIESLTVHQSLLGRLCRYGTLYVRGTGGALDVLKWVPDPIGFQEDIQYRVNSVMAHDKSKKKVT